MRSMGVRVQRPVRLVSEGAVLHVGLSGLTNRATHLQVPRRHRILMGPSLLRQ